jgi:hypothetical protein
MRWIRRGWKYNGQTYTDGGINSRVKLEVHLRDGCGVGEGVGEGRVLG